MAVFNWVGHVPGHGRVVGSSCLYTSTDKHGYGPSHMEDGWAAVDPGGLLRYDSERWSLLTEPAGAVRNLSFYVAENGWAAAGEMLLRWQDGRWHREPLPENVEVDGQHMLSDREGYAVHGKVSGNNQFLVSISTLLSILEK